jgi:hypothetical protein
MAIILPDEKTGEKLCAYAIGNGDLAVLWRKPDNACAERKVTREDAQRLCAAINAKERRSYRWFVSQCVCLSQATLSHT